jgi:eukaryotic-like serine/threonine-protein kinase
MIAKPGHQDKVLNYEADTALYFGDLGKARQFTRAAIDSAQKAGHKEAEALFQVNAALREALVGNFEPAKQDARAALALSNGRDVVALAAISLKLAGDTSDEIRLVAELEKRFPEDTLVQFTYLPALRELKAPGARGSAGGASPVVNDNYDFGGNLETVNFVVYPVYFRGISYLSANQGTLAAAEFKKILDHPGAVRSEPIGALARLQLGRALKLSGDTEKARAAYKDFFAVWKGPDIETPIFREAKAEYSALN